MDLSDIIPTIFESYSEVEGTNLETVDPVVVGFARAKADVMYKSVLQKIVDKK
jgi:hypothetical protein